MLIEAVTGHRYADELRDRILTPLALSNTYLPTTVDGTVTVETRMEPSLPWASGALVSTGAT